MKSFIYIFLSILLTSCGYGIFGGMVKPVYFSADSTVFTDTFLPARTVNYQNLMGLSHPCIDEIVELRQGEVVKAFISHPTLFRKENTEFLVYPGEHIFITANDYIPTFSTVSKNKTRDGELLVLKTFEELEKRPGLSYLLDVSYLMDYNYQTILNLEKELKSKIEPAEKASQLLFDSLCTVHRVSPKFKKLTKAYVQNRYDMSLLILYEAFRDTLFARQVYHSKIKALLPEVNGLTKASQFTLNVEQNTNYLYRCLFPESGIRNMVAEGAFQACFDSVVANFKGPARDYLLNRIMYHASLQGRSIPASYRKQYRRYSMNKEYRKIITRTSREYKKHESAAPGLPNELLGVDGKTKIRLEEVLVRQKGKYVLVDLWASWCMPCIEEMPALQYLSKRYPADKIVFLSMSVDRSISAWHNRLNQLQSDSLTNYLLLNQDRSALVKQIGLTSIPRYLIYDQGGNIINADAPRPSDPELMDLLDKLLLK